MFVTDEGPIIFCLRPCTAKKRAKDIILKHGGKCIPNKFMLSEEKRNSVIMLVPDDKDAKEDCYHVNYIFECEKKGILLPLSDFKIHLKIKTSNTKGRNEYKEEEDQKIIDFISNDKTKLPLTGNKFWKILASDDYFKEGGRTWQSIKDRYVKRIAKKTVTQRTYYKEGTSNDGSTVSNTTQESATLESSEQEEAMPCNEDNQRISTYMSRVAKIDKSKAYKCLFKFNGNIEAAEYYIKHGTCKTGYFLLTDEEDKSIIKSLEESNKEILKSLTKKYNEKFIKDRCMCLFNIEEGDMLIFSSVTVDKL